MRTISFKLGGKYRSLVAPKDAAAWALVEKDNDAILFFRLKKVEEMSALTALRSACYEYPILSWKSVGSMPWIETSGGVPEGATAYYILNFVQIDGDWKMELGPGMQDYMTAQRDIHSTPVPLPDTAGKSSQQMASLLQEYGQIVEAELSKGSADAGVRLDKYQ
jgi:hypothetical protein